MKCPEPSIKEPCYFCYNGECFATHWYECSKGFRKPHEGKKGIRIIDIVRKEKYDRQSTENP